MKISKQLLYIYGNAFYNSYIGMREMRWPARRYKGLSLRIKSL